jgi:hypothetical protein
MLLPFYRGWNEYFGWFLGKVGVLTTFRGALSPGLKIQTWGTRRIGAEVRWVLCAGRVSVGFFLGEKPAEGGAFYYGNWISAVPSAPSHIPDCSVS